MFHDILKLVAVLVVLTPASLLAQDQDTCSEFDVLELPITDFTNCQPSQGQEAEQLPTTTMAEVVPTPATSQPPSPDEYCQKAGLARAAWRVCAVYVITKAENKSMSSWYMTGVYHTTHAKLCFYCVDARGQMYPFANPSGMDEFGGE